MGEKKIGEGQESKRSKRCEKVLSDFRQAESPNFKRGEEGNLEGPIGQRGGSEGGELKGSRRCHCYRWLLTVPEGGLLLGNCFKRQSFYSTVTLVQILSPACSQAQYCRIVVQKNST